MTALSLLDEKLFGSCRLAAAELVEQQGPNQYSSIPSICQLHTSAVKPYTAIFTFYPLSRSCATIINITNQARNRNHIFSRI